MKILGSILILLAAIVFSRGYAAFEKKKIADEEGFCRFLSFVQKEFLLFGTPLPTIAEKAEEPVLKKNGYLAALSQTESAKEAFLKTKSRLSLSPDFSALLSDFSEHFGRESAKEEEKRLALWTKDADTIEKKDAEEAKTRIRLCTTLSFSLALGIVLLYL